MRTELVSDESAVYDYQSQFVADGFEGAIVRLASGKYQYGAHSYDLLKVKSFLDDEYTIVGHKGGIGKFEDAVIWVCQLPSGQTFDVCPKGTMEERRQWLTEAQQHYGSQLKVRYFETSEEGVPRFPVGEGIRAPEDIG